MRRVLSVLLVAIVGAGAAFAQAAANTVMGNWEGQFTSAGWETRSISAQVIAEFLPKDGANDAYRAVFRIGGEGAAVKAGVMGETSGGTTLLSGEVNLGKELGGEGTLTAQVGAGLLKGEFAGKGKRAAFELRRVEKKSPTLGMAPPQGAVVLLDGTNLDAWTRMPEKWNLVEEGAMQVTGSQFATKQEFGDQKLHLEFRTPFMPKQRGQGRGNSGVYVQGRYEVQVLDSFGLESKDNECGGIYRQAAPVVNACLPPGEWQTYDITFRAPKFDAAGNKTQDAVITVEHNGVVIHDNLKLSSSTPGGVSDKEAPLGVLLLQDHGNQVRYRNIWLLPLQG